MRYGFNLSSGHDGDCFPEVWSGALRTYLHLSIHDEPDVVSVFESDMATRGTMAMHKALC